MRRRWLTVSILLLALTGRAPGQDEPGLGTTTLPARALWRAGSTRLRHASRILCLAYEPHGKYLAAGGGNDPVRLWDPRTGREVRHFNDPWVQALAFTPSGTRLATAALNKSVHVWDVESGTGFKLEGHKAAAKALALPSE